jgi:hypothetical protein
MESDIDVRGLNIRDLEVQEMFQALHGMGLPEERVCTHDVVQDLLLNHKIRTVAGYDVPGTKRFCIEWIEFENGTKAYFGASAHGALIYRIANPINHTQTVLKELNEA